MTIGVQSRNDYVGANSTSLYAFTFPIFEPTDLKVTRRDLSNIETTLEYLTDYTVDGAGLAAGGLITLSAGNLPTGFALTIRRVVELVQDTDLRNQSSFFAEVHEATFDKLTMIAQQQQDQLDRTLHLPETAADTNAELPVPEGNHVLAWKADGSQLVNLPVGAALPTGSQSIAGDIDVSGDVTIGSGLVVDGTDIGGTIDAIQGVGGSSLVGFQQLGTGSQVRDVQDKLREMFSVFDFMTPAQIANVKAGTVSIDVTAAIQAAIAAAAAITTFSHHPEVYFPPGAYYAATGIVVSNVNGLCVRGPGAVIVIKSDIEAWKWDNCRDWHWDGLGLATTTNTTKAALRIANGSIGYHAQNFRVEYGGVGGQRFKHGVLADGSYIGVWVAPYMTQFSVSDTGMWFKDGSGIGTYPPAAISILAPNIGAGVTGILFEDTTGSEVIGGTIEDTASTKNIWIKNSKFVTVQRVHCEVDGTTTSNVYIENSSNCTVDTIGITGSLHAITLKTALRCQLRNLGPYVNLDIDVASTDNLIVGGHVNSSPPGGLLLELGTRTMILGATETDNFGMLVLRTNGAELFRVRAGGSFPGTLEWGGADTILFRNAAGNLRTTALFTPSAGCQTFAGDYQTTTGKGLFGAGLGVGNSAAGTTPGSVVKKIPVYALDGTTVLGYIAVFDAIT